MIVVWDQKIVLMSNMDLPYNLEFDTIFQYSDGLSGYDVPSYTKVNLRVGWFPESWCEFSLMLENLFDDQHPEFGGSDEGIVPSEVPRSFYGKVTFRF
jgi:iron complex outermembrane receptor protein